jgi:hypothetical protein
LSPVSTHTLMPAAVRASMASGTPSCKPQHTLQASCDRNFCCEAIYSKSFIITLEVTRHTHTTLQRFTVHKNSRSTSSIPTRSLVYAADTHLRLLPPPLVSTVPSSCLL